MNFRSSTDIFLFINVKVNGKLLWNFIQH